MSNMKCMYNSFHHWPNVISQKISERQFVNIVTLSEDDTGKSKDLTIQFIPFQVLLFSYFAILANQYKQNIGVFRK